MDPLLHPQQITTLGPKSLRVQQHLAFATIEPVELTDVFPTESVFQIKQRIAELHDGDKAWMPNQLFLATKTTDGYKPLDTVWPFDTDLADPLNPATTGAPDPRLYDGSGRKAIAPVLQPGLLLSDATDAAEIHVWNLKTIAQAAGHPPSGPVLVGFYQLYFPWLTEAKEIEIPFAPEVALDTNAKTALHNYRALVSDQYSLVEKALGANPSKKLPSIHELRQVVFQLPKKDIGSLELLFYRTEPSAALPFLRFFPAQARMVPLVKYSKDALRDSRVFDSLMADQPHASESVLLLKAPIQHPRAPFGTVWTLRIYDSGTAELGMGAPRRDAPLPAEVVIQAFKQLDTFLTVSAWKLADATLDTLTATYAITSPLGGGKPGRSELEQKLKPFLTLFHHDMPLRGDKASLTLRYKAISNYRKEQDPKKAYLTTLFLRDSSASEEAIPVEAYIAALQREFGISLMESNDLVGQWLEQEAELVKRAKEGSETEQATFLKAHPTGISVSLYNNHPRYLVKIAGCDSQQDLQRILSCMSALVSVPTETLALKPDVAEVVAESAAAATTAASSSAAEEEVIDFGEFQAYEEEETEAEAEADSGAVAAVAAAPKDIGRLGATEIIQPIISQWYLMQMGDLDDALFRYTNESGEARVKLYSSCCQFNNYKQPNIMSEETYAHVRALYGTRVFWVEAALPPKQETAVTLALKTVRERVKLAKEIWTGASKADLKGHMWSAEKLALSLGFEIDNSILSVKDYEGTPAEKAELAALQEAQAGKDMWIVVRAGSNPEHPNYFICAELWCVRDGIPVLRSEFEKEEGRDGKRKDPNSCPFCGGTVIQDRKHPGVGETVLVRPPATEGGKVAKYAGFLEGLYHPKRYALPCCFLTQRSIIPPEGSEWVRPPSTEAAEPVAVIASASVLSEADAQNRDRPFQPKTKKGTAQNPWYIPNQNIVGRNSDKAWIELEQGLVAVPPAAVNALLGQDPESFLTKNKGIEAEGINSYLAANTSAFVRYSLGNNPHQPGLTFLKLIAYAWYVTKSLTDDTVQIPSTKDVLRKLEEDRISMLNALEQGGYGTLLHEMSKPGQKVTDAFLEDWCKKFDRPLASETNRPEMEQLCLAYNNFADYMTDKTVPKDLRLWESLFACPGLLTDTGVLLVIIRVGKKGEPATVQCPTMGVALAYQQTPPPFLFLLEDAESGSLDPLVLYDGSKDGKILLGALYGSSPFYGRVRADVREALSAFFREYINADTGCGSAKPPIHPWMPVRSSATVPRLSALLGDTMRESSTDIKALLRDRANRLVGLVGEHAKVRFMIPALDDGRIIPALPSLHGEHELPHPSLDAALAFYSDILGIKERFPMLAPHDLIRNKEDQYVAINLECGATVPIEPQAVTKTCDHPKFTELKRRGDRTGKREMPWDMDARILDYGSTEDSLDATSEEILEESYEYLRISISNWFFTDPEGRHVAEQVDRMRTQRQVLPLFELQKRLEYLLFPVVTRFITLKGTPHSALLRKDCLQIKKASDCTGGCAWVRKGASKTEGQCLIHTTATPRYKVPANFLTARLVDELLLSFTEAEELLRHHVSPLKPLGTHALLEEGDAVLFAAPGSSSDELLRKLGFFHRRSDKYTRGLSYPEEVGGEEGAAASSSAPRADLAQRRIVAEAGVAAFLKIPLAEINKELGHAWTGSDDDWQYVGNKRGVNVILLKVDGDELRPSKVIRGSGSASNPRYIIIGPTGQFRNNGAPGVVVFPYDELPADLRTFVE